MHSSTPSQAAFTRFSLGVLAYNLAVIAWGAFVRASGSGAGCGSHWPLCNGEVVPRAPKIATLIELTHRLTSGVALILVVVLTVWAFRAFPRGSAVRKGAVWSLAFMLGEALIGAALVLFELVAYDASLKRALSMSLHLTNTFLLLGALSLTMHWASGGARVRLQKQGAVPWVVAIPLVSLVVVGTSGAVAALGDTLFHAPSLKEGMAADFAANAHVLVRLRVLHPFLAAGSAVAILFASSGLRLLRATLGVRRWSYALSCLVLAQVGAGVVNLALLAPTAMQLVHLVLADLVWIASVMVGAHALADGHEGAHERIAEAEQVGCPGLQSGMKRVSKNSRRASPVPRA